MNTYTYSEITSMRVPREVMAELNALKILPEEPSYKVLQRLIDFYKKNGEESA